MAFTFLWGDGFTRYGAEGETVPGIRAGMYASTDTSGFLMTSGLRANSLAMTATSGGFPKAWIKEAIFVDETGISGGLPNLALHRRMNGGLGTEIWSIYYQDFKSMFVTIEGNGQVKVWQRSNSGLGGSFASTTLLLESSEVVSAGSSFSVQCYIICDATAGEIYLGINGFPVGSITPASAGGPVRTNNIYTGGALYDRIDWQLCGVNIKHQDWAIGWNGLPPDGQVLEGRPIADAEVGFTPSTAGSNYKMVDDPYKQDDLATKNSAASTLLRDRFRFGLPSFTDGTVHGIMASVLARKDLAGTGTIRLVNEYGGNIVVGAERSIPAETTIWRHRAWTTKPNDGLPYLPTDLSVLSAGYQRVS